MTISGLTYAANQSPIFESIILNHQHSFLKTSYIVPITDSLLTFNKLYISFYDIDIESDIFEVKDSIDIAGDINPQEESNLTLECDDCTSSINAERIGNYKLFVKLPNNQYSNLAVCPERYTLISCSGIHSGDYELVGTNIGTNFNNLDFCSNNLTDAPGGSGGASLNFVSITCFNPDVQSDENNFHTVSAQY